ncbi:CinA family protein [Geomonas sp. RF6]|uniref:CinA family protein n=1 Tax=Geomonas sp. RF6 TaxID=2897342 RepID=UPI003FA52E9C
MTEALLQEVLKLYGVSPEEAAARLALALPWDLGVKVEFREMEPELHLALSTGEENGKRLQEAVAAAKEALAPHIFASGSGTMEETVANLFRCTGATLSLAESCTGGMIAARITEVAGSSAWFLEGIVSYSNAAKSRLLSVPATLIEKHGAVSEEVAVAMAQGARDGAGSDLALAVTGIAGPEGGSPQKPVGTVYIAVANREGCHAQRHLFRGDRQRVRELTVFAAFDWLRRDLLTMADTCRG